MKTPPQKHQNYSRKFTMPKLTHFFTIALSITAIQITGCGGGDASKNPDQRSILLPNTTGVQLTVADGLNPDPAARLRIYKRSISELNAPTLEILRNLETTTNGLYCGEDGIKYTIIIETNEQQQKYSSNNNWCNQVQNNEQYISLGDLLDFELALKLN